MKILVNPFKTHVEQLIYTLSEKYDWYPLALEIMRDNIHFFVSAHQKLAPMRIIQRVKITIAASCGAFFNKESIDILIS
jgi:REP element-mobilizing transposase RayT